MPDHKTTILSTSSLPLEKIGAIPDSVDLKIIPFIEKIPFDDAEVKEKIENLSNQKIVAVFTSAEAVNIVRRVLQNKRTNWIIYCIRNETHKASAQLVTIPNKLIDAENAYALSEKIATDGVKDVWFFSGNQRLDRLPENLARHAVKVSELQVYETRMVPVKLSFQPDILFFFSPSAVRSYFLKNELFEQTKVFLIGNTTAETFKKYSSHHFTVSPEPDKLFVYNMAIEYVRLNALHE